MTGARYALWTVWVGLILAVVAWPLANLISLAVDRAPLIWQQLQLPGVISASLHSVEVSAAASFAALLIGAATALVIRTAPAPSRSFWSMVAILPLLVPPFVGAFSWLQAYARAGLSDQLWGISYNLYGPIGVTVLLAVHTVPLAFLPFSSALNTVDPDRWHAARVLGASDFSAFRTAVWPQLRPVVAATAGLLFAFNAGDFGIPLVLGIPGRFPVLTTQIYQDLSYSGVPGSFLQAIAMSLLLALLGLTALLSFNRSSVHHHVRLNISRPPDLPLLHARGYSFQWLSFGCLASYSVLTLGFPFIALALTALTRAYGMPPLPINWTLAHFIALLHGRNGLAAEHSLMLAAAAASILTAVGMLGTELGHAGRLGASLRRLVWIPYALPGSVIAVAAILAFDRWLYGTLAIILLAYLMKFWGLLDPLTALRSQVDPELGQAARLLGAETIPAYRAAVWPFLRPMAAGLWTLVFIGAFYELTMSSLLYTPATQTLAVVVLNAQESGDAATTAAVSTLATLVMFTGLLLIRGGKAWLFPSAIRRRLSHGTPDRNSRRLRPPRPKGAVGTPFD